MSDPMTNANRALWNEWTSVHESSAFYDLAGFRSGRSSLRPLETEELGDVSGKSLLHLMCHFGLDTLSLARCGAQVTGCDLSDTAIELARAVAKEQDLEARFITSDIYDLPDRLTDRFDLVFTSWGVLAWLSDLPRWGQSIADFLLPGGSFYMAEIHPIANMLDMDDGRLTLDDGYLADSQAECFEVPSSYAEPQIACRHTISYQWQHSLAEVVTSLLDAGLVLDCLHEWPFCVYQRWPAMSQDEQGWWYLPERHGLPLSFSLRAHKPGEPAPGGA